MLIFAALVGIAAEVETSAKSSLRGLEPPIFGYLVQASSSALRSDMYVSWVHGGSWWMKLSALRKLSMMAVLYRGHLIAGLERLYGYLDVTALL